MSIQTTAKFQERGLYKQPSIFCFPPWLPSADCNPKNVGSSTYLSYAIAALKKKTAFLAMAMFQLSSSENDKKPDHPASQHLSAQGASARSFPCTATKTWPKESQKKAFPNLRSGEHEFGDHQNAWTGKPRSWETKRISMCLPQVVFKNLLFILFRFLDQW